MIEGLRDLGKTVFLTTHYMDEAENLADRLASPQDRNRSEDGRNRLGTPT